MKVIMYVRDFIFVSGQLPVDPTTGEICSDDINAQTSPIMINISQLLGERELPMDDAVKTTCFLTDMNNYESFNQVYALYFSDRFPEKSAFQVVALLKGELVEIEWIFAKK